MSRNFPMKGGGGGVQGIPQLFLTKKAPPFCVQNHHFMLFLIVNVNPFWSIFHIFAAETPVFPRLCEIDLWLPILFPKKDGADIPQFRSFSQQIP